MSEKSSSSDDDGNDVAHEGDSPFRSFRTLDEIKETATLTGQHRWSARAAAFRRAAEELLPTAVDVRDSTFTAMAYCWRHYVELALKDVTLKAHELMGQDVAPKRTHHVGILWREAAPLVRSIEPEIKEEEYKKVESAIELLEIVDPRGEDFRYPVRSDGQATLEGVTSVHIPSFHSAMTDLANWIDGRSEHLSMRLFEGWWEKEGKAEYSHTDPGHPAWCECEQCGW